MKTHVIQLDPQDDLVSTRDKMAWSQAPRILLIFPVNPHRVSRALDLILLKRRALELGAQLAIVSQDAAVQETSADLNIPLFRTAREAQRRPWRRGRRHRKINRDEPELASKAELRAQMPLRSEHQFPAVLRWGMFLMAALAVLAVLFFFLPGAIITIPMMTMEQTLVLEMHASPDIPGVSVAGALPAQIETLSLKLSGDGKSTGVYILPQAASQGKLRLSNMTTQPLLVPQGTVVRTLTDPPVRFQTHTSIELPAGIGKEAEVIIQAVSAGSSGNVPAGSVQAVEGSLGLSISVTNPIEITGGSEVSSPAPSEADYRNLKQMLLDQAIQQAQESAAGKGGAGINYIPASFQVSRVLGEKHTPEAGQPGQTSHLELDVEVTSWSYAKDDLNSVALIALDANLKPGYVPIKDSLKFQEPTDIRISSRTASWKAVATRQINKQPPAGEVIALVMGKPRAQAAALLGNHYDLTIPAQIQITPGWFPWMPFFYQRIQVQGQ